MLFIHTVDKVLNGSKVQTRRIQKPTQVLRQIESPFGGYLPLSVVEKHNGLVRPVYVVGKTYAVQPGRGKAAVARIEIIDIKSEDVRQISEADAKAEGFANKLLFLVTWCKMHDPAVVQVYTAMYNQ